MAKRSLATILGAAILLAACSKPMTIDGVTYDTYGLLNADDKKNPEIEYKLVMGNVIWAAILAETVVAPIYFFGFDCFEPVGRKTGIKGQIGS